MYREVILDTETTGLDPASGDRIIEIGAVELVNHLPTGRTFHVYINPEREISPEAEAVHGISSAFLRDKPVFAAVAKEFLTFVSDSVLVIHNAAFDIAFLNAELAFVGLGPIPSERVVDTLFLARQKHPGGSNSLDALCRRYGVDNSKRTKHGALLDSELLAEVYLELIGGRQTVLVLETRSVRTVGTPTSLSQLSLIRTTPLTPRLTEDEKEAHRAFVAEIGDRAIWRELLG